MTGMIANVFFLLIVPAAMYYISHYRERYDVE